MKTPRELLLKRHDAAGKKLDALRKDVLARECEGRKPNAGAWWIQVLWKLWSELIRPAPRTWAGLAAVWLAIIAVRLADTDASKSPTAPSLASAAGFRLPWGEQERILAEFTARAPVEPEPLKTIAPKPRSQRRSNWRLG